MATPVVLWAAFAFVAAPMEAPLDRRDGQLTTSRAATVPSEVAKFFDDYFKAVESGEPSEILALIDEDFVIKWPVGHPISDRERLREALISLQRRVRQVVKWEILEAHVIGNWAWVRSNETATHFPKAGGAPRTFAGSRLSILRKVRGRWLLHRDYGSLNDPP